MEKISNKAASLQKFGLQLDITKAKDILGKDTIKALDILNNGKDVKIDKMSDIFPRSTNDNTDDLLS